MQKLAIVGTHSATRDQAPFDDPEYDIWVFNEAPQSDWCLRWSACFQLHRSEVYTSPNNHVRSDHWNWLQQAHGRPIYMQALDARVPDCQVYPLEVILAQVPGADLRWFDCTASYALALAIYQGYREIDCYGLDMRSDSEYGYQLRNFQFWIGVAIGAGIRFGKLSNESYFGSGRIYGYDGEIQIDRAYFNARVDDHQAEFKHADWALHKLRNRIDDAMRGNKPERVAELIPNWRSAAISAGEASGSLAAAEKYVCRDDLIPRQEFERGMAQAQKDGEDLREQMWHAGGKAEYVWNVWRLTGNPEALKQLRAFTSEQMQFAFEVGVRSGLYREHLRYLNEIDRRVEAAGGMRTVRALTMEDVSRG